jgi:hypothetical protein
MLLQRADARGELMGLEAMAMALPLAGALMRLGMHLLGDLRLQDLVNWSLHTMIYF